MCLLPLHVRLELYDWDGSVMLHFLPVGDCPGYVTFILDLHYGMPLALFVSFSLWYTMVTFVSSLLLSNVFWSFRTYYICFSISVNSSCYILTNSCCAAYSEKSVGFSPGCLLVWGISVSFS